MCELKFAFGKELTWAKTDDEIVTGPILRHSAINRHCGFAMAVTETHIVCRSAKCQYIVFRWEHLRQKVG